ncbi:fructosamine kinase family protein [Conexibacter sp. SYSU D00693]|uniref:fructosamine kinase family protein n=1 Tax=Conexibacter sp. SYSU D00693 TaxID=2812560 RepID=UPI00196A7A40|nr:fructosamine kinase family protein [Conexibacter sp. SYSU D00693]
MSAGLRDALGAALGAQVLELQAVPGGDLNAAHRARLPGGREVFVKSGTGGYAAEAASLRWLGEAGGGPPVPDVVAVQDDGFLALEWVAPGRLGAAGEEELGRRLAALHRAGAPAHGWTPHGGPVRLGPLELPSDPAPTFAAFYAASRLAPMTRAARDRGGLDAGQAAAVEAVAARIDDLAGPEEPPSRLHGDLWAGNVHAAADGRVLLIDPAAHGGHREVDLAMLRLFGGPGERLHRAYAEVAPLAEGHEDRVGLWQLLPLLVHAALFGGGYGARAAAVARSLA